MIGFVYIYILLGFLTIYFLSNIKIIFCNINDTINKLLNLFQFYYFDNLSNYLVLCKDNTNEEEEDYWPKPVNPFHKEFTISKDIKDIKRELAELEEAKQKKILYRTRRR